MNWRETFNCLHLNNQLFFNEQVDTIAHIRKLLPLIYQRQRNLLSKSKSRTR